MTRGMLAALLLAAAFSAQAAPRSRAVLVEFQRAHPCPANGAARGACPGYVKDHVVPLCAGGADAVGNLQWQTVADAKAKDREEVKLCRALKPRTTPA